MRRLANPAAVATIVGSVLLLRLVYGEPFLNYDASYALVWAQDIARGATPDYNAFIAPTPHPLQMFVSFLALPLGSATTHVLAWLVMLSMGALVWTVYLLGRELFSRPVGALAAVVLLTRSAFAKNAEFAYADIPFALFVTWALLLELRSPRRGAPVLVLLTFAGLLRPDGWVLAAAYWLWLVAEHVPSDWRGRLSARRPVGRPVEGARLLVAALGRRPRPLFALAVLGASGGVLWAISDAAITGDFLHSFHGTKDLAAQLNRPRSVFDAPFRTAQFLGFTLREPLLVGVPIGCVFVLAFRRRALVLLGIAAGMALLFIASTLGGLPLIARYVLTPSVFLTVVYAAGCLGWLDLPQGSAARRTWQRVGLFSLALSFLFIPFQVTIVDTARGKVANQGTIQRNLKIVADASTIRTYYQRCGRISTFDHPEVPPLRYYLDAPPGAVMDKKDPAHPLAQTLLMPVDDSVSNRYYQGRPPLIVPDGFTEVYRSRFWRLMASPRCRAAVTAGRTLGGIQRS